METGEIHVIVQDVMSRMLNKQSYFIIIDQVMRPHNQIVNPKAVKSKETTINSPDVTIQKQYQWQSLYDRALDMLCNFSTVQ